MDTAAIPQILLVMEYFSSRIICMVIPEKNDTSKERLEWIIFYLSSAIGNEAPLSFSTIYWRWPFAYEVTFLAFISVSIYSEIIRIAKTVAHVMKHVVRVF